MSDRANHASPPPPAARSLLTSLPRPPEVGEHTLVHESAPRAPGVRLDEARVHRAASSPTLNHPHGTPGENRVDQRDRAKLDDGHLDDELVEEIFGQLWVMLRPIESRVPAHHNGGCLVWVHHELLREKRVRPEDCFSVSRSQRIIQQPTRLSSSDISFNGGHPTYAETLRRLPMVEGGRWVWQADKPRTAPRGGFRAQQGRGRGAPQQSKPNPRAQ
jgi:hypothetical protein